jgi:hypothetical protein
VPSLGTVPQDARGQHPDAGSGEDVVDPPSEIRAEEAVEGPGRALVRMEQAKGIDEGNGVRDGSAGAPQRRLAAEERHRRLVGRSVEVPGQDDRVVELP